MTADAGIEIVDRPAAELREAILGRLLAFNAEHGFPSDMVPVAVVARDAGGAMLGGLWGKTSYGWLMIEFLVVEEAARGGGLGARLVGAAEEVARLRGCTGAWLTTFTFQAREFYEKLGYEVFGELPRSPRENVRLLLRKDLGA